MPRTRNFVLFLIGGCIVIAGMVFYSVPKLHLSAALTPSLLTTGGSSDAVYQAEVPPVDDDRASRLQDLRSKLADRTVIAAPPEPAAVVVAATTTNTQAPTTTAPTTSVAQVQKCSGYNTLSLPWVPQRIVAEEREGVRLYTETIVDPIASTTNELIHARIALRTWPLGTVSCLSNDIVGIATDGSLIRNSDVSLYKIFPSTTLIGYTLDGYPLYGVTPGVVVDSCGGAMVAGAYRYLVDPLRPTIITCFSGIPASIQ